jgi:glycosyltransferase involved in cell wall biosynthesis
MKTIAYLVSEYPSASHTFIRREIAELRKRGFTIAPFSVRAPPANVRTSDEVGIVVGGKWLNRAALAARSLLTKPIKAGATWRLAQQHRPPGFRGWLWSQFHFVEALILAEMLRQADARHLHSHFANSGGTVGLLAARLVGIPWSLTLHGISETDYPAGLLLASKVQHADFVACASWFIRAQAMRVCPVDQWPKLTVVRCGVEPAAVPPMERTGKHQTLRIVTVGRLSPEKGTTGLIEAVAELKQMGVAAQLTIVGDGPLREQIEEAISRRNLADRVHLLGALPEDETLREIDRGDLFVLASFMEGLPVVLMEAMAFGTPVIAPRIAGIPELVEHGVSGLLFRPGDWGDLLRQIKWCVDNPSRAADMGQDGQRTIAESYRIDRAVEPLAALFAGRLHGGAPDDQRSGVTAGNPSLA